MAYAFRIHDAHTQGATSPASPVTMQGWTQTAHIVGNLLDNIIVGTFANKMGTSIPSFFARMDLFRIAFEAKRGANVTTLSIPDVDTKLISECLDMLEFLFIYGNDERLVIRRWNAVQQIQALKASRNPKHCQLAEVLSSEVINRQGFIDDIYLFFWRCTKPGTTQPQDVLIGGTSPYTLVYTSPNWKKYIIEYQLFFNRLDGSPLFCAATGLDSFQTLDNRNPQFAKMLYGLRQAYGAIMTNQCPALDAYINTFWLNAGSPNVPGHGANTADFVDHYPMLPGNITAAGLPICYEKIIVNSGYQMKPSSNIWRTMNNLQATPLALTNQGLPSAVHYLNDTTYWNNYTINIPLIANQELNNRRLPATGVVYPFVTVEDFLEDNIIKVPQPIQTAKFYVANGQNGSSYMLPLKSLFLQFFKIDDIDNMVSIDTSNDNDVTITIRIPIEDATYRSIDFVKHYDADHIKELRVFNTAFFPFYKVLWTNAPQSINRYEVITRGQRIEASFYCIDTAMSQINQVIANGQIRTRNQVTGDTTHYAVAAEFDFMMLRYEVKNEMNQSVSVNSLVIPKMTNIIDVPVVNKFDFAIDFGTSNTHIAYRDNTDINNPLPHPFTIAQGDEQTILLLEEDMLDPSIINRELTPIRISADNNVKFPLRSAICETNNFATQQPNLFQNITAGFNFALEQQNTPNERYVTDLKWLLENPNATDQTRVQHFLMHLLWIVKNKSILNGGGVDFTVRLTYPESMPVGIRGAIRQAWQNAQASLQLNHCRIDHTYIESISPYNCLANLIGGNNYMNVDIGGGTNDILLVEKENGVIVHAYYSSARFAANDLWGDGITIAAANYQANGFLDRIVNAVNLDTLPAEVRNMFTTQYQRHNSADTLSFIFAHTADFNPGVSITSSNGLYALLMIHYGAIMYNLSRLVNKCNMEIPEMLSFTGLGSRYIQILSGGNDKQLISLTKLLLEKYTGKACPKNFQILQVGGNVKEITANGVLTNVNAAFTIPQAALQLKVDYGFNTDLDVTYGTINNHTDDILNEYNRFIDTWDDKQISNLLNATFGITMTPKFLQDLKGFGKESFDTMMGLRNDPAMATINLPETMFFWPLKNAIYKVSLNYNDY